MFGEPTCGTEVQCRMTTKARIPESSQASRSWQACGTWGRLCGYEELGVCYAAMQNWKSRVATHAIEVISSKLSVNCDTHTADFALVMRNLFFRHLTPPKSTYTIYLPWTTAYSRGWNSETPPKVLPPAKVLTQVTQIPATVITAGFEQTHGFIDQQIFHGRPNECLRRPMGCVSLYKDVDCSLITSTPYEGVLSLSLCIYIYIIPLWVCQVRLC